MGVVAGDLDDLVQTTFLMALSASQHFDGRASARGWLLGLAANAIRRHRRSLRRFMDRLVQLSHEPTPRTARSAEDAFSVRQTVARAEEAIGRLSQKKREVFLLVAVEGVSGEQAAAALHIPVATVWTRLHHARRDLRRLLGEDSL
jgi:RNA polymerase sigma-70 factor (ECF subfamily)